MINKIFGFLIIIGLLYSFLKGNVDTMGIVILDSAKKTFDMSIQIFALMALWLGIMKIASSSGLLSKITKLLRPLLKFLFPDIPSNHESLDYISSNIIANMFGLGNAATPFGLKAMKSLKKLSNDTIASDSMITFLILNTTGFTLIPTTILSLRIAAGSNNPSLIIPMCLISSFLSLLVGIFLNYIFRKVHK